MMESSNEIESLRMKLIASLRKKSERASTYNTAVEAMSFLRNVVVHGKYDNSSELLALLDVHSALVIAVNPSEFCLRNAFWLVQKLIREENLKIHGGDDTMSQYDSITKFWNKNEKLGVTAAKKLKRGLIGAVKEVVEEMESSRDAIAAQAADLVQSHDCIICLSLPESPTLSAFLKVARKKKHRVLAVSEHDNFDVCPDNVSPIRLVDVASKIVEATKIILPGVAVFPDGSCFVPSGGLQIALAAQRHAIPIYVLAAFYKITPMFIPDPHVLNPKQPPRIPFSKARSVAGKIKIHSSAFDLIPANLVALYVTNSAAIVPAHVYRLIGDYYHPEDIAVDTN